MSRYIDQVDPAPDPRDWTRRPIVFMGVELSRCDCGVCWADLIVRVVANVAVLLLLVVGVTLYVTLLGAPA